MESDTILIFVLVTKTVYTGKSPLGTSLVKLDIEIYLICPLSVNQLITPHKLKSRPFCVTLNANPSSALFEVELPPVVRPWCNISTA